VEKFVKKFVFLAVAPALSVMLLGVVLGLLGCGTAKNDRSGNNPAAVESYLNAVFSAQVINPDAPNDRGPLDGYPGDIAERAYTDYKDTFGSASKEQREGERQAADMLSDALSGD